MDRLHVGIFVDNDDQDEYFKQFLNLLKEPSHNLTEDVPVYIM